MLKLYHAISSIATKFLLKNVALYVIFLLTKGVELQMKRKIFVCMLMVALFTIVGAISVSADDIRVQVDGIYAEFDVPPIIIEGRTLLPARAVVEMLGGEIEWNGELQQVQIFKNDIHIVLIIDDNIAYLNDQVRELDVPPQLIEGRTLVPLRFITESFGLDIDFYYGTVFIQTPENPMVTSLGLTLADGTELTVIYTPIVRRNAEASVFFTNRPNAVWNLSIRYSAGYGTAAGLGAQVADSTGFVEWSWRIGSNTTPGQWPVTITGNGENIRFYITVVE